MPIYRSCRNDTTIEERNIALDPYSCENVAQLAPCAHLHTRELAHAYPAEQHLSGIYAGPRPLINSR